jgi:hypothetical protein
MTKKTKLIIFGAGIHGRAALRKCNLNKNLFDVVGFLDNDKLKTHTQVMGKKIFNVGHIDRLKFDKIIFCGYHIKSQVTQIKKLKISESSFLIWGRKDLKAPQKIIDKRSKDLVRILRIIVNVFKRNKISYWIDKSSLLGLFRKQNLAEFSDVDIALDIKDIEKVNKIFKDDNSYIFYSKIIKFKKGKLQKLTYDIHMTSKCNLLTGEPAIFDFNFKKFDKKFVTPAIKINSRLKERHPSLKLKNWKKKRIVNYKKIKLNVPYNSESYLCYLYDRSWHMEKSIWTRK